MFLNYLKLSVRLLTRNPLFAVLNVVGLAMGFASFFLLWQYAQSELGADQFVENYARTYRWVNEVKYFTNEPYKLAITEPEIARQVAESIPEIEDHTRVFHFSNLTREYAPDHDKKVLFTYHTPEGGRISFPESKAAYADDNVFEFFSLPLVQGDPGTALDQPNSVVISEALAKKYFGSVSPVGMTLLLNGQTALQVTGVFRNLPPNSHLDFSLVISSRSIERHIGKIVLSTGGPHCYFRIRRGIPVADLSDKINRLALKLAEGILRQCGDCKADYQLQPLKDISFDNHYAFANHRPRSAYFLSVLSIVSVIILVMAWSNYISMSLSFNMRRLSEMGVRRTVGAQKSDLIGQFVVESLLINSIALLFALTLIQLAEPLLGQLFDFYVPELEFVSTESILILVSTIVGGIGLTGIYQAWFLSRHGTRALTTSGRSWHQDFLANNLPAAQFMLAIGLLVWIFSISDQLNFILRMDTGFLKEGIVEIDLPNRELPDLDNMVESLREQVLRLEGIEDATVSSHSFSEVLEFVIHKNDRLISPKTCGGVDERFIPLYHIPMLAGRNFMANNPADERAIILSRTAIQRLGYAKPEDAIGEKVLIERAEWTQEMAEAVIVGVIEDTRVKPLFSMTRPGHGIALTYKSFLVPDIARPHILSVKLMRGSAPSAIPSLQKLYTSAFVEDSFTWHYLNEKLERVYTEEQIFRNQILLFTVIAAILSCLGLLGMISAKVAERTHEIGIRKVLGAKAYQLAQILLSATLRQFAVAALIGLPISYFLTQQYLQKFSERISMNVWHFTIPVGLLLLIMTATIASKLWKATTSNPVEVLKHE